MYGFKKLIFIRKQERLKTNELNAHLSKLEMNNRESPKNMKGRIHKHEKSIKYSTTTLKLEKFS